MEMKTFLREYKDAYADKARRDELLSSLREGRRLYSFACAAMLLAWLQQIEQEVKTTLGSHQTRSRIICIPAIATVTGGDHELGRSTLGTGNQFPFYRPDVIRRQSSAILSSPHVGFSLTIWRISVLIFFDRHFLAESVANGTVPPMILVYASGGSQTNYCDSVDGNTLAKLPWSGS
jgi:hypothetical protein